MNKYQTVDQVFTKRVVIDREEFDYEKLTEMMYETSYIVSSRSGPYFTWDEVSEELKECFIDSIKYLATLVSRRDKGDPVIYHCYVDCLNKQMEIKGWKYDKTMSYDNKTNPDMVKFDDMDRMAQLSVVIICDMAWNIIHSLPKATIEQLKGLYP